MIEPIRKQFTVSCDQQAAFALWTEQTSLWWPKSHKVTRDPDAEVVFERRVGGRIFERATAGREVDWGEILLWDPPERLAYLWHIGTVRTEATRVDVQFSALDSERTEVRIEHSGWEKLGIKAETWRNKNHAGWNDTLPHYQQAAERWAAGAKKRSVG